MDTFEGCLDSDEVVEMLLQQHQLERMYFSTNFFTIRKLESLYKSNLPYLGEFVIMVPNPFILLMKLNRNNQVVVCTRYVILWQQNSYFLSFENVYIARYFSFP